MHAADTAMIEQGDMFVNRGKINKFMRKLISLLFRLNKSDRFKPDLLLQDGDDLSGYGLPAVIVALPGHSKGSLGILTTSGDLFCGDLLVNTKKPEVNTLIDEVPAMAASLEKIRGMQIQTVYPGHGNPFKMELFLSNYRFGFPDKSPSKRN